MPPRTEDISTSLAEVTALRQHLVPRAEFRKPDFLARLADDLAGTRHLSRQPVVREFIADLRAFPDTQRLTRTKTHINERRDNHLFSLFDASYFPRLSLDYLTYQTLPTNEHLARRYASNTMPVNILQQSPGFDSRAVVALFPENHLDGMQFPDDQIFYFINKFVTRHNRLTRRLLDTVVHPDSLTTIRGIPDSQVEQASSWWVRLHEFHHRQGDMPIPEFLSAKSYKPLAGLEELRVDVSGMLVCLHDDALPAEEATRVYEYILAERLLRYAIEGIPRPNYDAVASQLLFNFLTVHGGIELRHGLIRTRPELPETLAEFLGEITAVERRIHTEPVEQVRQRLLAFTNRYTSYDEEAGDYRHIPYFAEIKQRLGI